MTEYTSIYNVSGLLLILQWCV